jgi:alpha-mannosidase II
MMRRRFRPRRYLLLIGCALFTVVCIYIYSETNSIDSTSSDRNPVDGEKSDIERLKAKVHEMEENLQLNRQTVDEIKSIVRELAQHGDKTDWKRLFELIKNADEMPLKNANTESANGSFVYHAAPLQSVNFSAGTCRLVESLHSKAEIQMMDVFEALPFDNPDGGVWKQGFPIKYDADHWKSRKLKVFVVPHSHNDPGWIKTFERYYEEQTRQILNLMVEKLEQYHQMRFIYAEMSFFSLWWSQIDARMRERVRKLLSENRLEIVTGGWVMTDEATAHYFAMLDQLIEGNQWLVNEVGVTPTSGWAIDPFGHSPTMAYLLGQTGIKNMLIQRVHYSVKKYLAERQQLEFAWRQNWDRSGRTDMFCHLMPFYSYDIPHTCGPNPSVCCQFDFRRLHGSTLSCPWKIPPVIITDSNVNERAKTLLEQYREKSHLYKNDVVLIPLGDDFRYDTPDEWDNQFLNYQKLFDYMNRQSDWNVEAQFGTLTDYFNALRERAGTPVSPSPTVDVNARTLPPAGYPVLSGDFYTYSDRDDHYWSGYFTSRPFYKGLDRVVEGYQRAGEILYSLAVASANRHQVVKFPASSLLSRCTSARRNLALFQHHDGITGTARDFVVANYGDKLLEAIGHMKKLMMASAHLLLMTDKAQYSDDVSIFDVDDTRESHDSLPVKTVISLKAGARSVVFYNSLVHNRTSAVRVHVDVPNVEVRDADGRVIRSQVDPFFVNGDISTDTFKLVFIATVPAFGLVRYTITAVDSGTNPLHSVAKVTLFNTPSSQLSKGSLVFTLDHKELAAAGADKTFTVENSHLVATVSVASGSLQQVMVKDTGTVFTTDIEFVRYGTRPTKERSGAYLFLPDGDAKPIEQKPTIRVIRGLVASEVHVSFSVVQHVIRLTDSPGLDGLAVDIQNLVDIRRESNYELAMRLQTNINNADGELYTDLNGFQMQRRKTYEKLPLHANFYPMTTTTYLQDDRLRLSVLGAQSLGVASLKKGWLEVMQDRRLDQDDNRGLQQPVHDNKETPNRFRLLFEQRQPGAKVPLAHPAGFASTLGHLASADLIHPMYVLPVRAAASSADVRLLASVFRPLQQEAPCELHVVNLRTIPPHAGVADHKAALVLHRVSADCTFTALPAAATCPVGNQQVALSTFGIATAQRTSLTLLTDLGRQDVSVNIDLPPMELQAYIVTIQ